MRVLGINDFHGNLEPPSGSSGRIQTGPTTNVDAGGAAFLATRVAQLSQGEPNTVLVGSGDLIGASPLISGIFNDEPTIEVLSQMGMDFAGVGNHEFDDGQDELIRMQYGGCHPIKGCQDGDPFLGAGFRYLSTNVRLKGESTTLFAPYLIRRAGGIPVAFLGLTLEGTPNIVSPAGIADLAFDDEADAVNRFVRQLKEEQGVESFVVLIHQGGAQKAPFANGFADINRCDNLAGDILDVNDRLSDEVDVVVTAHTHQPYVCPDLDGKVVTSASSFGRLVTKIDLTLDGATGDVKQAAANNNIVTRDVMPDPTVAATVQKYKDLSTPLANRVVGTISATISRSGTESPLGRVIADAQLRASDGADEGNAVIAFMNPGGVRADLVYKADTTPSPGQVTYGDIFTVQPFGNNITVKTFTGQQIKDILEQQFNADGSLRILLQVSDSLRYSYNRSRPVGQRVLEDTLRINGTPVNLTQSYRVSMNSFLADGGDSFPGFRAGTMTLGGVTDTDAFEAYLAANPGLAPPTTPRVTDVTP